MDPRTRLFLWAGTAVLLALSLQPAGEVLAADWRGAGLEVEPTPQGSEVVRAAQATDGEVSTARAADDRRS